VAANLFAELQPAACIVAEHCVVQGVALQAGKGLGAPLSLPANCCFARNLALTLPPGQNSCCVGGQMFEVDSS
jgi:hypothetical protein